MLLRAIYSRQSVSAIYLAALAAAGLSGSAAAQEEGWRTIEIETTDGLLEAVRSD